MTRARGADFSSAQSVDETAKVARTIDFAFVKATQGTDYVNPVLHSQVHMLRTAGVLVGYYHFLDPASSGAAQWDHFELELVGMTRGPVAIDYEASGTTDAQARAFIRRGRQRGFKVGLYGGEHLFGRARLIRLGGPSWSWVAYWSSKPPPVGFDVWQFTDGAGRQDYNVFRGGRGLLEAWWKRQSAPRRRKVRLRWWLTDTRAGVALGPFLLAGACARLLAYNRRHPASHAYTLELK